MNSGDGNIVETTPVGAQVAMETLDSSGSPPGAGALFGLAVVPDGSGVYFVDDAANELGLLHGPCRGVVALSLQGEPRAGP